MKKQYICPQMTVVRVEVQQLIAHSIEGLEGMEKGGEGSGLDVDARINVRSAWEEEW